MDTPIFDGVLGDRLTAARQAVEQAGRDAQAFAAALDAGQTQALGQLVELKARALVAERTSTLTTRVALLERELRVANDRLAAPPPSADVPAAAPTADRPSTPRTAPVVQVPGQPVADPGVRRTARTSTPTPTSAPAQPTQPARPARPAPAVRPRPAVSVAPVSAGAGGSTASPASPERTGRKAADEGPTGADVPSVPSMRDLFAGSRAASWLDGLLGAKR